VTALETLAQQVAHRDAWLRDIAQFCARSASMVRSKS
jgi:hypothetical protein